RQHACRVETVADHVVRGASLAARLVRSVAARRGADLYTQEPLEGDPRDVARSARARRSTPGPSGGGRDSVVPGAPPRLDPFGSETEPGARRPGRRGSGAVRSGRNRTPPVVGLRRVQPVISRTPR